MDNCTEKIETSLPQKEKKDVSDWRLRYFIEYFLPETARWEFVESKLKVIIPLEDKEEMGNEIHLDIEGDNLVRIPNDFTIQEGPNLEYEKTEAGIETNESGLVLLLDHYSIATNDSSPRNIKEFRKDNQRFQDLKFVFWPSNHVSYKDTSVYYPKVNTVYTPIMTRVGEFIGNCHEIGHAIDSEEYPEDYVTTEDDHKKSKKQLAHEQTIRESRAWDNAESLIKEASESRAMNISKGFVHKYKDYYLGNYQQEEERIV